MTGFSLPSATRPMTVLSSVTGAFFDPDSRSSPRKNGMMSRGTTSPACAPTMTITPFLFRHLQAPGEHLAADVLHDHVHPPAAGEVEDPLGEILPCCS